MRRRAAIGLLVCLVLAGACGGRVTQEQVLAEAGADGSSFGAAGGTRAGLGTNGDEGLGVSDGSDGSVIGGDGGSGGSGTAGGSGSAVDPDSTKPEGGNGGATDVGVTADKLVFGNVSTLSGPVPGLFRGALVGAQAWAAMVNSQGGIDGRLIEIKSGDDALDTGRNKNAHKALKDSVLAFVGSFSVTDGGGVSELQNTNIPDIGTPLDPNRFKLPNNFAPGPLPPGWETGPVKYYLKTFGPKPMKKTAFFVAAVETARVQGRRERAVIESLGYEIVYTREIQPNEPNYTGDVIQMRNQGVQNFMFEGQVDQIAGLINAMAEQSFRPTLLNPGATAYSDAFVKLTGKNAEGSRIDLTHALFLDPSNPLPEVQLFRRWMAKVDPNQEVDLFAMYAWASGRMIEKALHDAGPAVTRDKLLAALGTVTTFDSNGLIAPVNPAGKRPTDCFVVVRLQDGKFVREHPASGFDCTTGGFQPIKE